MKYEDKEMKFDPDAIIAAITPKTKIIVIANPNNPTANFMGEEAFRKVAEQGVPLVVDEAYIEFAGYGKSMTKLIKDYPNVMVTRTMSKAYGIAGVRFGYMLSNPEVIKQISATLIPWNISTIALWAAYAAFCDQDALKMRVDSITNRLNGFQKKMAKIPGMIVFESYGNYILFDATDTGKVGEDIVKYVEEKCKIILRNQNEMYGRDGWFRITIGVEADNKAMVEAVKEYCAK